MISEQGNIEFAFIKDLMNSLDLVFVNSLDEFRNWFSLGMVFHGLPAGIYTLAYLIARLKLQGLY